MSLQTVSSRSISTIIVEPRVLVRDSLNSLVMSYSYRVIGSYASAFAIPGCPESLESDPILAIIGAQSINRAIEEALCIRELFANIKIVVLLETVCAADIQRMSEPTIDACIPLYASRDVLIRMLEVVTSGLARVVVLADAPPSFQATEMPLRRAVTHGAPRIEREIAENDCKALGTAARPILDHGADHVLTPFLDASGSVHEASNEQMRMEAITDMNRRDGLRISKVHLWNGATGSQPRNDAAPGDLHSKSEIYSARTEVSGSGGLVHPATPQREPRISDRELQILDGLVKGHGNKMIARECAITEATVKVHMKSILRKICVANRTQAAIWAIEHGFCTHVPDPR